MTTPTLPLIRIVDDDETFAGSQKLFLQAMGWHVQTYSSGRDFLGSVPTKC